MTELNEIQQRLIDILKGYIPSLKVTLDSDEKFEVSGTIKAMQGKKEVDGIYFASVVPKAKDVRFYFFPAYTHREQLENLIEPVKKALKGKSCFHIKKMDEKFEGHLKDLVQKSVELYKKDGLLE